MQRFLANFMLVLTATTWSGAAAAQGVKAFVPNRSTWLNSPGPVLPVASATNVILNVVVHNGSSPFGCTVNETDDTVLVVDLFSGLTHRYDRNLAFMDTIDNPGGAVTHTGIAYARDGSELLYWIEPTSGSLYETTVDGVVVEVSTLSTPGGGIVGGLCYRLSTDTLIADNIVTDQYFEASRSAVNTGFSFPNPDDFPPGTGAFGNGISHDEGDGFHIATGRLFEGQVFRMNDLDADGALQRTLWEMSDPDPGNFDSFVNGHCYTELGGTLGRPAEYIVGNATNVIVEMDSIECVLGPITNLDCSAAGDDVVLTWIDGDDYDTVTVRRNGTVVGTVAGGVQSLTDVDVSPGYASYLLTASDSAGDCADAACVVAAGGPFDHLIFAHPDTASGAIDDAAAVQTALARNGVSSVIFPSVPDAATMADYEMVWVLNGTYPDNYSMTAQDGDALTELVTTFGTTVWQSGSVIWTFDAPTAFDEVDGVRGVGLGCSDLFNVTGEDSGVGLDLTGFDAPITMEQFPGGGNDWIDHLAPDLPNAEVIFSNADNSDDLGVFHNAGNYIVFSTSFEFGSYDGDRGALMNQILNGICPLAAPLDLTATSNGSNVELTWTNDGVYTAIEVRRDGGIIDTIPGDASAYDDLAVCAGIYTYKVRGLDGVVPCGGPFSEEDTESHGITPTLEVSTATPLPIPDNDPAGVEDTIEVNTSMPVQNLDIDVEITHTYHGDLVVFVTSPLGTSVQLHDRDGRSLNDIIATYDDDGVPNGELGYACDCAMQPSGPGSLADFNGEDLQGEWTLTVIDTFLVDIGTLESWEVHHFGATVCSVTPPVELTCGFNEPDVDLSWDNGSNAYAELLISRNGTLIASVAGTGESFTDISPPVGALEYQVVGVDDTVTPCCRMASPPCRILVGVTDLIWAHSDTRFGVTNDAVAIQAALVNNGRPGSIIVKQLPSDLSVFDRVWCTLGTWSFNHPLRPDEGTALFDYCVESNGRLYVSGSDVWGFDPQTDLDLVDGVALAEDGPGACDTFMVTGQNSLQGLDLSGLGQSASGNCGECLWIDHLDGLDDAGPIWTNDGGSTVGCFNNGNQVSVGPSGNYRVLCQSWEFATFGDEAARDELMAQYLSALGGGPPPVGDYIRGDVDGDGTFNGLLDGLTILNFQFVPGSTAPPCLATADVDGNRVFNGLVDAVYTLSFQFLPGSPPPPPPFPGCGEDQNGIDALGCDTLPPNCQ